MSTKRTKPEVFGDKYKRALISSIAGYELMGKGKILLRLKSGEEMVLIYQVEYLAKIAFAKLDSYFKTDTPESVACNVCQNKDKIYKEESDSSSTQTYCDYCYKDKEYFGAPGGEENE